MNNMEKEIIEVSLDNIIPNRFQPRLSFDEQGLNELAKSIRQHGIIQPLVLRKLGSKYEIIAGERRYKASYIAGLTKVPAIIIDLNDNESAEVAIVENLQRQDLSPIEEAKSYKKLLDRGYLTQDQLATRMGKTQATISNKLRLLNLANEVQEALLNNKISERHARSLLRLPNQQDQIDMLNEIISKRLNVKLTEDAINAKIKGVSINQNVDNILPHEQILSNQVDTNQNISTVPPVNEPEIVSKDNFVNPSFIHPVENGEVKSSPNPIPFIRPVYDDKEPEIESNIIKPIKTLDETLPIQNIDRNIQMVEDKVNDALDAIKNLGFEAKLEQYDFENLYQFVIKVNKK